MANLSALVFVSSAIDMMFGYINLRIHNGNKLLKNNHEYLLNSFKLINNSIRKF